MNLNLKFSLIERGVPDYKTFMEANIHPSRGSKFIAGLATPKVEEMERLSEILKKPVSELFPAKSSTPLEVA